MAAFVVVRFRDEEPIGNRVSFYNAANASWGSSLYATEYDDLASAVLACKALGDCSVIANFGQDDERLAYNGETR